jgi:hypothetical protein
VATPGAGLPRPCQRGALGVGHAAASSPSWRTANYSANGGGNCVEIGTVDSVVAVRDSKDPDGPRLVFAPEEWQAFVAAVKAGEFGLV